MLTYSILKRKTVEYLKNMKINQIFKNMFKFYYLNTKSLKI